MAPQTIPENALWGIQGEVFTVPDSAAVYQPTAPPAMSDPPTDDELAAWGRYAAADKAFEDSMLTLVGDDANWDTTVSRYADEDEARANLPILQQVNEGNPFNRNFVLVWSPPRTWTVVD